MKPSEYRKIYIACARLYGFIFAKELFSLLKHYQIPLTKEEVYKDLDSRVGKWTRGYTIAKGGARQYVIADPYLSDEMCQKIGEAKNGKPYYYPASFEAFLKYANLMSYDDLDQEAFTNIRKFLKANVEADEPNINVITHSLIENFKYESLNDIFSIFEELDVQFKTKKSLKRFLVVVQKYVNNVRTPFNNGFTPMEMRKILGPIDMNKVQLTMGPNMRQNLLDGVSDPFEMLKELEKDQIPRVAKESLRKELLEIIEEIKRTPKD